MFFKPNKTIVRQNYTVHFNPEGSHTPRLVFARQVRVQLQLNLFACQIHSSPAVCTKVFSNRTQTTLATHAALKRALVF